MFDNETRRQIQEFRRELGIDDFFRRDGAQFDPPRVEERLLRRAREVKSLAPPFDPATELESQQ